MSMFDASCCFPCIPAALESLSKTHDLFLDERPIRLIQILPLYAPDHTLYTLQYTYIGDDSVECSINQLTVTHDGHGYSSQGKKYRFHCLSKMASTPRRSFDYTHGDADRHIRHGSHILHTLRVEGQDTCVDTVVLYPD